MANAYPLPAVCKALGISEVTLSNWSRRGRVGGIRSSGRGNQRMVPVQTIISAAIMRWCQDLGIPPQRSRGWTSILLRGLNEYQKIRTLFVRHYDGGIQTIRFDDEFHDEPPEPGARTTLEIDVRSIVTRVKKDVEDVLAQEAASVPPSVPPTRPGARARSNKAR